MKSSTRITVILAVVAVIAAVLVITSPAPVVPPVPSGWVLDCNNDSYNTGGDSPELTIPSKLYPTLCSN